jgi:hypothetical protein
VVWEGWRREVSPIPINVRLTFCNLDKPESEALCESTDQHFGEKGLVDLTLAIIAINGRNRLVVSFRAVPGLYQPARIWVELGRALIVVPSRVTDLDRALFILISAFPNTSLGELLA